MMEGLADAPREMGIGRGDDHSFECVGLVFGLDSASERMFGFDTGFFIAGESDNLLPSTATNSPVSSNTPLGASSCMLNSIDLQLNVLPTDRSQLNGLREWGQEPLNAFFGSADGRSAPDKPGRP